MSATRFPKIAELRDLPIVGTLIADVLDAFGIEDCDLPDMVPGDIDYDDPQDVARCFPKLTAKLAGWAES